VSVVSAGRQTVTKLSDRVRELIQRARDRWPVVDHGARAGAHYGDVLGSQLAAGVTYFGFLSFFPLIALGFAVVGYVVAYVPEAGDALTKALSEFLPGLVGDGKGQINVEQIASAKAGASIIGLVGLLYSGLGAVSALRTALHGVFNPGVKEEQRNFVVGKAMDLVVLFVVGLVAVISVSVGSVVTALTGQLVEWLGLSGVPGSGQLLWLLGSVVGIGASTLAFFTTYRLLPKHAGRSRDLLTGALIAAIGFEVLKQLAGLMLGQVTSNALYGAFAVMVALLVWINYTSRLAVLGATWAATATASARGAGEVAGEAADDAAGEPSGKTGDNSVDDPVNKIVDNPVNKTGRAAVDDPVDKIADRTVDENVDENVAKIVDDPGDRTGDNFVDKVGDKIGDNPADKIVDDSSAGAAGADVAEPDAAQAGPRPIRSGDSGQAAARGRSATRGRRFGHALGRRIGGVLGRRRPKFRHRATAG
jgi:membrane protein